MTPLDGNALLQALAIVGATFVSEDATCIATGLLIHGGQIGWLVGIAACTCGIFLGDLALWLTGRVFGRRVMEWRWVRKQLPEHSLERFGEWFDRRGWAAVLAARFVPGTRLPVYLAAGVLGRRAWRFALWALLAALLWTPALVILVAVLGPAIADPLRRFFGAGWLSFLLAIGACWLLVRLGVQCASPIGRAQLWARFSRLWRWEFWPMWLFYAPLAPWIVYLALRHRGVMTPTAANPGIRPHGGIVGESKFAILSQLPREWIVPSVLLAAASHDERMRQLQSVVETHGWQFPLILKPDAGQRGAGVRLIRDWAAAQRYVQDHPQALVAQVYHPGPYEAGIFYCRMPDAERGRIFSITDKRFPSLIGDGESTVESLIWRHPRLRMQAATFLARMNGQAGTVLAAGQHLPLAIAGNHCQGTMFVDGAHLITPQLEASIDDIARRFDGFHFGRFDVRYSDPTDFAAGRGYLIIELNGVTSESTNLYDPEWSILRAYGVLFRQWGLLFAIGAANRRRGRPVSSLRAVIADSRAYYRERRGSLLSD